MMVAIIDVIAIVDVISLSPTDGKRCERSDELININRVQTYHEAICAHRMYTTHYADTSTADPTVYVVVGGGTVTMVVTVP